MELQYILYDAGSEFVNVVNLDKLHASKISFCDCVTLVILFIPLRVSLEYMTFYFPARRRVFDWSFMDYNFCIYRKVAAWNIMPFVKKKRGVSWKTVCVVYAVLGTKLKILILILHLVGFCCHMCSTSLYQGRPG
jgi:hypothetical protein